MSDRIAVMNAGRIEQVDTPDRLYSAPATPFVAGFVGEQNAFPGKVVQVADGVATVETAIGPILGRAIDPVRVGEAATCMVRPERVGLVADRTPANRYEATLRGRTLEGPVITYEFELAGGTITAQAPNLGMRSALLASVHAIGFDVDDTLVFRKERADA